MENPTRKIQKKYQDLNRQESATESTGKDKQQNNLVVHYQIMSFLDFSTHAINGLVLIIEDVTGKTALKRKVDDMESQIQAFSTPEITSNTPMQQVLSRLNEIAKDNEVARAEIFGIMAILKAGHLDKAVVQFDNLKVNKRTR